MIEVTWLDHFFDDKDFEPQSLKTLKPMKITTKGILAGENKQMLVVCQSQTEEGTYSECTYIMKKCIVARSDKV